MYEDQHFLANEAKIEQLIDALDVKPDDIVCELGAGQATVAAHMPACRKLYLVEIDPSLADELEFFARDRPNTEVVHGDAIAFLERTDAVKIASNLPHYLTNQVMLALQRTSFDTAVVAMLSTEDTAVWETAFEMEPIAQLDEDDFEPRQPFASKLVRVTPKND